MSHHDTPPILSRDPSTGDYIADFRIQIPAEIYQRTFFKYCTDENIDLANLEALANAMTHIGAPVKWLIHPHTKITPIAVVLPQVEREREQPSDDLTKQHHISKTKAQLLYERLREKASHVAPYRWEDVCQTPVGAMSLPQREKADIGRLRYDERKILKQLYAEWQGGDFVLDSQVEEEERIYQEKQQAGLTMKVEAVAEAVNGNRIR